MAQWLGRRISDQVVPGSNPGRCTFRCGLEQVLFTLLTLGRRLRTHKVFTEDQCFYLNFHEFTIKSCVLDVY